jgi:hypothetical protein
MWTIRLATPLPEKVSRVPDAFFTLLRRAGTHGYGFIMDPGSAAHRFALRSVRGTPNLILRSALRARLEGCAGPWFETAQTPPS